MKGRNTMELQKAKTAAIAATVATAIALTGTFAWQSISQMARNEATEPTNPGGRLHDDFSGYGEEDTKDIYVENFGNEPIYARVRLDEYMELGEGAGLRGTVGAGGVITPDPNNHATSLVPGAKIDDVTTWTTHLPGDPSANIGAGVETGFTDPSKTFHTYWTWTMGGQATDNPDGKTVYMPTFNKNKDSLMADINGTLAGTDPNDTVHYDDYKTYAVGDTADRVRDPDTATYPDGAAYDADDDTTDECGPYGGAGGTGVAGTNYEMQAEDHTAQETMNASVITMAEYKEKSDEEKAAFLGWVYDVDGWAYWSQPIAPGTPTDTDKFITNATGVLLDRIVLTHKPTEAWYYSINAVGQFITEDDLGRTDDPQTGFYTDGAPTDDALDLLEGIGVNTAAVKGAIVPSATVTVGADVKHLTYAVQGMDIDLSAVVSVDGIASPSQAVTWILTGAIDTANTKIDTSSGSPVLHVGAGETGTLKLMATSNIYDRLRGKLTLPVETLKYIVTVTADDNAASVLPGGTQGFTAKLARNDFQTGLPQTFTWSLDGSYKTGTTITADTDTSKATLTADLLEPGPITVKATPTDTTTYPGMSGTVTIPMTEVTYTVDIKDSAGNKVTGTTVEVPIGGSATFDLDVTSTPPGVIPTDNWTWSSGNVVRLPGDNDITVDTNGKVSVADGTPVGMSAIITATNSDYDPALTASFTVKAKEPIPGEAPAGATVTVDDVEYIVLVKEATVTGKADGETVATPHKATLLLSKDVYGSKTKFGDSPMWNESLIRAMLNDAYLKSYPTVKSKAIEVTLYTRGAYNDPAVAKRQTTQDKVFLLSEADVLNTANYGSDTAPQSWEYTYDGKRIPYFETGVPRIPQTWWLRSPALDSSRVNYMNESGGKNSALSTWESAAVRPAFWYNLDP